MATSHRPDSVARERANELIRSWDARPGPLGSLLGRVTPVDQVGVDQRVDALKRRSIKKASKLWALDLAIRMMDLTTLEGKDTPGKIRALSAKAIRPKPGDPTIPSVAALCVYPALVAEAKEALKGSSVKVASVATGFPSGQTFLDIKLAETRQAVEAGADEVDMVIDRGAFLTRRLPDGLRRDRRRQGGLRRGAPQGDPRDRRARDVRQRATGDSVLAMAAGADFIKTSTGKVQPAATLPVTLVMLEAIRDFERATGRQVGMKPAGGIRVGQGSDPVPRRAVRDARAALDEPGLVPLRRIEPAQRRAHADRVPAERALPGPRRLHARLTRCRSRRAASTRSRRSSMSAGPFLEAREPEHQLTLGILGDARMRRRLPGVRRARRRAADGRVVATAIWTPPWNVILSEVDDEQAIDAIADSLAGDDLGGVNGAGGARRGVRARLVRRTGADLPRRDAPAELRARDGGATRRGPGSLRSPARTTAPS